MTEGEKVDVRSKLLKIRNIPQGHKLIDCINTKPYFVFSVLGSIGLLLVLREKYMILGILLVFVAVYSFLFIKNERLIEFYDDYCVFYRMNANKDECFLLFWNDISAWEIHPGSEYDELSVTLRDQRKIVLKCVCKHKLTRYFKRYVNREEQETAVISKTI